MRVLVDLNLLWMTLQPFAIRKYQKEAKRNWTVYFPLFMSYIDDYSICVAALLFMLISIHCRLA